MTKPDDSSHCDKFRVTFKFQCALCDKKLESNDRGVEVNKIWPVCRNCANVNN